MSKEPDRSRPPRVLRVRRDSQVYRPASITCYSRDGAVIREISFDDAATELAYLRATETLCAPTLWIDVECPGSAEEEMLRSRLHLHPLAVEDSMRGRQRPKLDRYEGYIFLVGYSATLNVERERTALEELHMFVGNGWIITVHDHNQRLVQAAIERWKLNSSAFPTTPALSHAILDTLVDSYLPVIDYLGNKVDQIEYLVLSQPQQERTALLLDLRRELSTTRRALRPMDEIIRVLLRRDAALIDPSLIPYYQDVLDHVRRDSEELDSLRDTLAATLDAYLSVSSNQLNNTVRVMAAWSIILMAMAWIAGIYGMNFDFMPELHWRLGYAWALGLMLITGALLLLYFRRRRWL
jgi:magnesium transporter